MSVFGEFAKYYDDVHRKKDYAGEACYVDDLIRRFSPNAATLLDIGCGTGNYTFEMAEKGYKVTGLDASQEMIEIANDKLKRMPNLNPTPKFFVSTMEEFQSQEKVDVVICLFFVLCYQVEDELIAKSFETVARHLNDNGILVLDFWNAPGVLSERPSTKIQRCETDNGNLTKLAEPELDESRNFVKVNYTFYIEDNDQSIFKFEEVHNVRYLHAHEVCEFLEQSCLKLELLQGWMSNRALSCNDWSGIVVARKR